MTARATATIVNHRGLHARASARFVGNVTALPGGVSVEVSKDGACASGGSILSLMMLGAAKGDRIAIAVDGPDEDAVLARLVALVESGFGEE